MTLEQLMKTLKHRTDRRLLFQTRHNKTPESFDVCAIFVLTIPENTDEYAFGDCVVVTDEKWWAAHRESILSKHVVLFDGSDKDDAPLPAPVVPDKTKTKRIEI